MPLVRPPNSAWTQMVLEIAALLEADAGLRSYFGWEPVTGNATYDLSNRRRIHFADTGTVSQEQSPKLVLSTLTEFNDFRILGDNPRSDIETEVAILVYVFNDKKSNIEDNKLWAADLHAAVRRVIRQNVIQDDSVSNPLWSNVYTDGPAAEYDSTDSLCRAVGCMSFTAQKQVT
jgi:hypothetical protein